MELVSRGKEAWLPTVTEALCLEPRCSPRGTPACRGTFGGRRKAVRDRLALQGGPLSSCVWNLQVFPEDARGCHCPFIWCLPPQGCLQSLHVHCEGERVIALESWKVYRAPARSRTPPRATRVHPAPAALPARFQLQWGPPSCGGGGAPRDSAFCVSDLSVLVLKVLVIPWTTQSPPGAKINTPGSLNDSPALAGMNVCLEMTS